MSSILLDTHKPCQFCGKPFESVARRNDGMPPLKKHETQCGKNPTYIMMKEQQKYDSRHSRK